MLPEDEIFQGPEVRILSMDGAASAALQLRLLRILERRRPGFLSRIQMLAGASDSATVTLFLASHLTHDHKQNLDVIDACIRFSDELLEALAPRLWDTVCAVTGLRTLRTDGDFMRTLERHYDGRKVADLQRAVLTVTLDVAHERPMALRNFGWNRFFTAERKVAELAYLSSSFPLWLPVLTTGPWLTRHEDWDMGGHVYVDGSLIANNPTLTAITNAISAIMREGEDTAWEPVPAQYPHLAKLKVVSLGASQHFETKHLKDDLLGWGWPRWLVSRRINLLSVLFYGVFLGSSEEVHNQARHLLGDHQYHRFAPSFPYTEVIARIVTGRTRGIPALLDDRAAELSSGPEMAKIERWIGQSGWCGDGDPAAR